MTSPLPIASPSGSLTADSAPTSQEDTGLQELKLSRTLLSQLSYFSSFLSLFCFNELEDIQAFLYPFILALESVAVFKWLGCVLGPVLELSRVHVGT